MKKHLIAFFLLILTSCNAPRNIVPDPALVIVTIESPTTGDAREPELSVTSEGRVILSWVEKLNDKRHALRIAVQNFDGWSEPMTVAEGDNWFINWADFPSAIGLSDGSFAAHWLVKSGSGTYAYDVNISRSRDGKTWTKPVVPHSDNTKTEHGFASLIPLSEGRLGAIWLDGRNMKDLKADHDEDKPSPANMTLRYATIDASGKISDETELDERVCECCQTSAALSSDGIVAVYRDRSSNEVRDIYTVGQTNGAWRTPQAVHADNWQINGCPVNGPSIAAAGKNVAVAWYTEAGGKKTAKISFSTDAGKTFGLPIQFDDGETQGRVDVVLLPDNSSLVCWLAGTPEGGAIKARRVQPDGKLGPPAVIAQTDISRSSGFPRMALSGNQVSFAWTEFGKPSKVRTAVADVSMYDNTRDGVEDITYQFRFNTRFKNPDSILGMAAPNQALKGTGGIEPLITWLNDPDYNEPQTYSVTRIDRSTGKEGVVLAKGLLTPPNKIGPHRLQRRPHQ